MNTMKISEKKIEMLEFIEYDIIFFLLLDF